MHWKQYTTLLNHSQQFIEITFPPVYLASVFFSKEVGTIDHALQSTTRSRSDYVRILVAIVASAIRGIAMAWLSPGW